jgi:programmed cell death 6-interacting protein
MGTMGNMLVPPRKKSQKVDYAAVLTRFLSNTYSPQEAADNNEGIKILAEMRAQALSAEHPSDANIDNSVRYWAQLFLLDKRIDFNQVGLNFTWMDAFKGPTTLAPGQGKLTCASLHLEMAAVLFNAACLLMAHGSNAHNNGNGGAEGLKTASQSFKKAAGMFAAAKTHAAKLDREVTVDMSAECLTLLENLCLAHAQRCFYEKAKGDNMKDGILAKLAAAAWNFYGQVTAGLDKTASLAKHFKGSAWQADVAAEEAIFRAAAHMHAAKALAVEHKGMEKGAELGHLKVAQQGLEAALKLKISSAPRAAQLKALLALAQKEYADARKENETVYHCSEQASAPAPEGKAMVKSEAVPEAQQAVGHDRFSTLVPDTVRRGALTFATRRQEWCNQLIHDMNGDTETVRRALSNITPQIEACDLTEPGLPRRLREKIQLIQEQDGCRGLLQRFNMAIEVKAEVGAAMAGARRGIQEEEDTDNRLRGQYGTRWTRATSASLNGILKQEAAEIEKNLVLAAKADDTVEAKINENRELLDMLGFSVEQLDAQVAGAADKAYDVIGAGSAMDQMKEQARSLV